jgi:hypothetical protein
LRKVIGIYNKTMDKFYLLYSNKQQEKLLSMAKNEEKLKEESEYYKTGTWFAYDAKENSNLLENEKEMKGIKFPAEPKVRARYSEEKKNAIKWIS